MRAVAAIFWLGIACNAAVALPQTFAIPASALQTPDGAIAFEDRSGIPLGTVLSANQERAAAVPLDRISPLFLQAVRAAEDRRFYRHAAVDWIAAGRAVYDALRCSCNAGGASTIDMQVARMRFGLPQGFRGKALQLWYASRIDAGSSKDAILEAYANRAAMGGNVYGVEAAAREYFGIPASDLDAAQAALLAGIPNDPAAYDPRTNWRAARARQAYVLRRMTIDGFLSSGDARAAARETLHLRPAQRTFAGAEQLVFQLAAGGAGNRVRTTIDLPLQRFVQAQARDVVGALANRNVTQAAALVVDNRTGDVLAYLGSLDYFDPAYLGSNDGVRSLRQPGSALKPFLYEYALERGAIAPDSVLADVPASYAIPGAQLYSPQDYSTRFAGPVTLRTALADSLNVPAVRVLSRVGVPPFLDRLRALGFEHLRRAPSYYGLGLTLGAGEVTLWDLTRAYVTMARGGNAIALRTRLDDPPAASALIGSRDDWELVADVLADRHARVHSFGAHSVLDVPFDAAVKTGTSSGYRDTWTVGFTSEYTVAVWAGNFSGAPMERIAGVDGAGPLWSRIMLHLYERRDPPPLAPPPASLAIASRRAVHADAIDRPAYDEWRAQEGATRGPLRILFPHDGDVFEDALATNDVRRDSQAIAFVVSRPRGAILSWRLNGVLLSRSANDRYLWPVRPGSWLLTIAGPGGASRNASFTVVRRPPHGLRGFAAAR